MEHLANTIPGSPPVKLKQSDASQSTLDQLQQAMYPDQGATAEEQVSQSKGSKHVVLLRHALLLVKTAELCADDDSKPVFVQALWTAIKQTASSITDYHSKAHTMPEHTEQHTPAEVAAAERIALLLMGIILPMLRQSLTACSHVPDSPHSQTNHNTAAHRHGALPCTTGILYDLLVCILMASSQRKATRRISELCAVKVLESGESTYCFGSLFCPNTHITDVHATQFLCSTAHAEQKQFELRRLSECLTFEQISLCPVEFMAVVCDCSAVCTSTPVQ
ncbi:hypothetical protein ABBQ38_009334 [Trebouxia sp. C0009 RCD-2024]